MSEQLQPPVTASQIDPASNSQELSRLKLFFECRVLELAAAKAASNSSTNETSLRNILRTQMQQNLLSWCVTFLVTLLPIVVPIAVERVRSTSKASDERVTQFEAISTQVSDLRWMYEVLHHRFEKVALNDLFPEGSKRSPFQNDYDDFNKAIDAWERRKAVNRVLIDRYWEPAAAQVYETMKKSQARLHTAFLAAQQQLIEDAHNNGMKSSDSSEKIRLYAAALKEFGDATEDFFRHLSKEI